jgi:hypothetical protein
VKVVLKMKMSVRMEGVGGEGARGGGGSCHLYGQFALGMGGLVLTERLPVPLKEVRIDFSTYIYI